MDQAMPHVTAHAAAASGTYASPSMNFGTYDTLAFIKTEPVDVNAIRSKQSFSGVFTFVKNQVTKLPKVLNEIIQINVIQVIMVTVKVIATVMVGKIKVIEQSRLNLVLVKLVGNLVVVKVGVGSW